jgi:molecular chaperone DnaK
MRREHAEAQNNADSAVYTAQKVIREQPVPDDLKPRIETDIQAVQAAVESGDPSSMREATKKLLQSLQEVGTTAPDPSGHQVGGGTKPTGDPR